jgi:hypothetical protein
MEVLFELSHELYRYFEKANRMGMKNTYILKTPTLIQMMDYYDAVLCLIPLSLAGVAALLAGAGLKLPVAVSTGGVVALCLVGHAMFVRGPTVSRESDAGTRPEGSPANAAD